VQLTHHPDAFVAVVKRYGRTTSAGGTTTVATPPPPSAATALNQAAAKGQGPTAPAQASALSASLPGTSQHVSADSVQSDGQSAGLTHQVKYTSFSSMNEIEKAKTMPFGIKLMRSQVLYRAAQEHE